MRLWAIRNRNTGHRSGVSTFFSREQAERKIQEWIERGRRGGRPDLSMEYLESLEPYELGAS